MSELSSEGSSVIHLRDEWYEYVNVEALSEEAKRAILEAVKNKLGFSKACEALDIAKSSLHRYLSGERRIPEDVVKRALRFLTRSEFESIVGEWDILKVFGLIRRDGTPSYELISRILALAARDEYLKELILRFVSENFKEDLRKMLGISFAGIKFEWSEDFERFLVERKKRRKIKDVETLNYYRSLFMRYLQSKELSEQLIDYVVNHENKWLRNVFRHYIQYLYYKRRISPETFGWLMEVVPSRSYRLDVRPYQINLEDVRKTLEFLKGKHRMYYTVYRVMLESGARFEHVLKMVESWRPEEVVEIPGVGIETKRLVCFEDRDFCRYYMGLRGSEKPCEWVYMSLESAKIVAEIAGKKVSRQNVWRYAKRHNLVAPKYMRKVAWRLMIKAMSREAARFIQSRFGELKISEARYEDLLTEADEAYLKYLGVLKDALKP